MAFPVVFRLVDVLVSFPETRSSLMDTGAFVERSYVLSEAVAVNVRVRRVILAVVVAEVFGV